jgi:hypothetical protein
MARICHIVTTYHPLARIRHNTLILSKARGQTPEVMYPEFKALIKEVVAFARVYRSRLMIDAGAEQTRRRNNSESEKD